MDEKIETVLPRQLQQCSRAKNAALCSQIAAEELSFAANFIQSRSFRAFEAYLAATAIYLALAILTRMILRRLGDRLLYRDNVAPVLRNVTPVTAVAILFFVGVLAADASIIGSHSVSSDYQYYG